MNKYFLLLLSALLSLPLSASRSDSLRQLLFLPEIPDSHKVNVYCELGRAHWGTNWDSAAYYARLGVKLADSVGLKNPMARAHGYMGLAEGALLNLPKAIWHTEKARKLFEETGDKVWAAYSYKNLGAYYRSAHLLAQSLEMQLKALKIFVEIGDTIGIIESYNNLGIAYVSAKDYRMAEAFHKKSLQMAMATGKKYKEALAYNNLGIVYRNSGRIEEAISSHQQALTLYEIHGDSTDIAYAWSDLGADYYEGGQYHKAIEWLLKAAALREQLNDMEEIAYTYNYLGLCYKGIRLYDKAVFFLNKSLEAARLTQEKKQASEAYEILATTYEEWGKYPQAFQYLKLYKASKEEMDSLKNLEQLNVLKTLYETGQQQAEIVLLKKDNEIKALELARRNSWILVILLIMSVGALSTWFFWKRMRWKQQQVLQEEIIHQQNMAAAGILEAEERERHRIASDLHDGVGQLFASVRLNLEALKQRMTVLLPEQQDSLDKVLGLVDESVKEVRAISHNMMPNVLITAGLASAVRDFLGKIDADRLKVDLQTVGMQERLEPQVESVLYRVIQESVNNVIKHAQADHLDIQLVREQAEIQVSIEDNGLGFDPLQIKEVEGMGLRNLRQRVHYLKGELEISSAPGRGTLVMIYVPV